MSTGQGGAPQGKVMDSLEEVIKGAKPANKCPDSGTKHQAPPHPPPLPPGLDPPPLSPSEVPWKG